jgi:hypothetical protein
MTKFNVAKIAGSSIEKKALYDRIERKLNRNKTINALRTIKKLILRILFSLISAGF